MLVSPPDYDCCRLWDPECISPKGEMTWLLVRRSSGQTADECCRRLATPLCDLHPPEAWLSAAGPWPPSFHLCPSYWCAQHARLPRPLVYDQTVSWHWSPWGKPSFNFAPSTITCGQPAGSALHYERNSKFEGLAKNSHLDLTYHYRIFTSIIWNLIIKTKT